MWSLCKLSLFQTLSGTWKVNEHLPQQDCDSLPPSQLEGLNHLPKAPGMSSAEQEPKAGPVGRAGTSEPQLLSPSCQLHPAAIYRAEVSHHPCKHPTSELQHRVIFEESLQAKATMTLLQRTNHSIFTHFLWGYSKVCEHISISHWELTERLQMVRETSFFSSLVWSGFSSSRQ